MINNDEIIQELNLAKELEKAIKNPDDIKRIYAEAERKMKKKEKEKKE